MRRWLMTGVVLFLATRLDAADSLTPVSLDSGLAGSASVWGDPGCYQPPHLRDTQLGARPHGGHQCSPTQGYQHYDLPSKHYGMWFRPAAFAEDTNPQCKPRIFNPRGYGWGHRLDCQQMDYHPYVVKNLPSTHGPSYYQRPPLEPCHCGLQGCGASRGVLTR
jgi:hypothetical protein